MRNSTNTPATFEQWLAEQAAGMIALPMPGGSATPLSAPRVDEQRLAYLATELLVMAIKLAVTLEVSRQASSARSRSAMRAAAAGGETNNA